MSELPPIGMHMQVIAKILGLPLGEPDWLPIENRDMENVDMADLGAISRYRDHYYLVTGDAAYDFPVHFDARNFLVATAPVAQSLQAGLRFDGYLNDPADPRFGPTPRRAISPDPGYTLPGGIATIAGQSSEGLFATFLSGGDAGGSYHYAAYSGVARLDEKQRVFHPYKLSTYHWARTGQIATSENRLQYAFAQDVLLEDGNHTWLYLIGSVANRFGGVKLGRIPVASFLDPTNQTPFSYYLGDGRWSEPVADEMTIDASVVWLIPPRDPAFSLDKNYAITIWPAGTNMCDYQTIAEFTLIWNPYLQRYLLLTGSDACAPNDIRMYSAQVITGPWTTTPQAIAMPWTFSDPARDYYAPFTTAGLLERNGQTMYFLASSFGTYGIYLYCATFVS
jgi:hypothetical protein